jgi:hypothetical protein
MVYKTSFSYAEAKEIGDTLGVNWSTISIEEFKRGLDVETEHGLVHPETNVTCDNEIVTGKLAWAHLREIPDYYTRLAKMEATATRVWQRRLDKQQAVGA